MLLGLVECLPTIHKTLGSMPTIHAHTPSQKWLIHCDNQDRKVYHHENSDRQRGPCMSSLHSGRWNGVSKFKACLGLYSKTLSQNLSKTVNKNTKLSYNFLEERTLGHTGHQYNARNDNKPQRTMHMGRSGWEHRQLSTDRWDWVVVSNTVVCSARCSSRD